MHTELAKGNQSWFYWDIDFCELVLKKLWKRILYCILFSFYWLNQQGGGKYGEPLVPPKTSPVVGLLPLRQVLFFFALRHVDNWTPYPQR